MFTVSSPLGSRPVLCVSAEGLHSSPSPLGWPVLGGEGLAACRGFYGRRSLELRHTGLLVPPLLPSQSTALASAPYPMALPCSRLGSSSIILFREDLVLTRNQLAEEETTNKS